MPIGNSSPPPPIINKQKSSNPPRQQKPSQTAWLATFKRLLTVPNTRSALLWLTGGILFSVFGKRAIKRHEEDLLIKDIENYLEKKQKKI